MNTPPRVAAQIGFQQTGGDHVAAMGHHREGQRRQHGPQQYEIIITEAAG